MYMAMVCRSIQSQGIMAENDDRGGRAPQRRRLQQVLTLSQKKEAVEFMTTSEALEGDDV